MADFPTFKGSWLWPWPWIGSYCIPSCITHRLLHTYQISFKSKKPFMDGRMYGQTNIFLPIYVIKSTQRSRPKNGTSFKCKLKMYQITTRFTSSGKTVSNSSKTESDAPSCNAINTVRVLFNAVRVLFRRLLPISTKLVNWIHLIVY